MIDIVKSIDSKNFVKMYEEANKPIFVQSKPKIFWDDKYLNTKLDNKFFNIQIMHVTKGQFMKQTFKNMQFNEAYRKINFNDNPNFKYYISGDSIKSNLPELVDDIILPNFLKNHEIYDYGFWYGESGNVTPLHFDCFEVLLHQISGYKVIRLYSPLETENLYPRENKADDWLRVSKIYRCIDDKTLKIFPKLRVAKYFEFLLYPGNSVYIPCGWWHYVYSPVIAKSINYLWRPKAYNCNLEIILKETAYKLLSQNKFHEVFEIFDFGIISDLIEIAFFYIKINQHKVSLYFITYAIQQKILEAYKKYHLTTSVSFIDIINLFKGLYIIDKNLIKSENTIVNLQELIDINFNYKNIINVKNLITGISQIQFNNKFLMYGDL